MEPGSLEENVDVAADQSLHRVPARGARLEGILGNPLLNLNDAALLAPVLERRHAFIPPPQDLRQRKASRGRHVADGGVSPICSIRRPPPCVKPMQVQRRARRNSGPSPAY